ncbi:hypothetical protein ABZ949_01985 [Micromonospora tulbaghiae]|uniref:hypothetical protein n=1 Tax=Micromonospora tulbaghiae TaxID=479978 RepID=UPI0033C2919A
MNPEPTPHTAWCQPDTCTRDGLDITHKHLIGRIADMQVWVQRADTTRTDGSHLYGYTAVHVTSPGTAQLTRHLDTVRALLTAAELFADQIDGVR